MKILLPRKNLFISALLLSAVLAFPGCIYVVVGSVGALGGYIASPDTVEGMTEADITDVWDEAVDVASIMGLVEGKNEQGGVLTAQINGAKVTVLIVRMSSSSVKLSVKARKHHFPKISLAQDVFVKIMSRVKE